MQLRVGLCKKKVTKVQQIYRAMAVIASSVACIEHGLCKGGHCIPKSRPTPTGTSRRGALVGRAHCSANVGSIPPYCKRVSWSNQLSEHPCRVQLFTDEIHRCSDLMKQEDRQQGLEHGKRYLFDLLSRRMDVDACRSHLWREGETRLALCAINITL